MGDKTDIFLRPVFRGKRFEEHEVPVEVLEEFRRYQALVIDLAKAIYFDRNPDRKRVPRGFVDRFRLALSDIQDGSAAPVLRRVGPEPDEAQRQLLEADDEFEEARKRVNAFLESTESNGPATLPRDVLLHFKYFGRTLREGESMELAPDEATRGPRLDKRVRQRVLKSLGEAYEESIELTGHVGEVDTTRGVFHLSTSTHGLVESVLPKEHEGQILEAHRFYRVLEIRLEGTAMFSPSGELKKVIGLEDIMLQDRGPELEPRFDEIRELEDGWYHGEGLAPRNELVDVVLEVIRTAAYEHNAYLPYVYPTPEGGLQLEWELDDWDVEIEFEPTGKAIVMAENRVDETWDEWTADISDEALAARIAEFIIERDDTT